MAKKFLFLCVIIVVSINFGSVAPATGFKDPGIEMVYVKGGCFKMGDIFDYDGQDAQGEKPAHEVCVNDFYMGKYEVTQRQWKSIMGSDTLHLNMASGGDDNCPVGNVSWSEIQDFIGRLNSMNGGKKYRLPTEAEWEYAARSGGKREKYSGGDDVDSIAWYDKNSGYNLHPVGTKAPNGLGIHDMSGNVWEIVNDWYGSDYYSKSPRMNPTGPDGPTGPNIDHVVRGGCASGGPGNQRTARRSYIFEKTGGDRSWSLGFRLAMTP